MLLVKQRRCRTEQQTDAQGAGGGDTLGVLNSLVTAVPFPAVPGAAGQEVGRALVLHPLREPQQHPHVVVCGFGGVGGAGESRSWRWSLFLSLSSSPPFPFSLPSLSFIHLLYAFILRSVHSMLHFSFFSTSIFVRSSFSFILSLSSILLLHPPSLCPSSSPFTLHPPFIFHPPSFSFILRPSIPHPPPPFSILLHPSSSILRFHPSPSTLPPHISSQAPPSSHHYPWQEHQRRIVLPSVPWTL